MTLVPITAAMVTPANPHAGKPRYGTPGDWHGGDVGNDVDVNAATQAIANSHSANVEADYEPHHQEEKAANMVPPLTILSDLGKDYGEHAGLTGRTGWIEPGAPYAPEPEPPEEP